ncbi:MAG TPA: hypothetical protein G4N92_08655 [Anaerolineae bacterium]|nr:hypothetical protein [Anaerolineae bacterium]
MDLLLLFRAVSTGITIGAPHMHYLAFMGAVIVIMMLLTINQSSSRSKMYIITEHYSRENKGAGFCRILRRKCHQMKSSTVLHNNMEIAFEIVVNNNNLVFMDVNKRFTLS